MKNIHGLLTTGVLLLCGACSSTPVHFYTLNVDNDSTTARNPGSQCGYFDLLPPGLPAYLDQPQLVIQDDNGRIRFLETERWSAPLGDELYSLIASQLTSSLGISNVHGLSRPGDGQVTRIKVQLQQLGNRIGRQVDLRASWSLTTETHSTVHHVALSETASGGIDGLVSAERRVVRHLAREIASSLKTSTAASGKPCRPDH
jgi:uncharacterized lipoprotein YmbA